jgi:phospholipid/cholesterol/gamma-HCH transport system ATP-binding protein
MASPGSPSSTTTPQDDAIVRFRGVTKAFGSHVILDGIDLNIRAGQTTVVLGPSGAGKSVLLKHIAGLLRPDRGEVWFRDHRVDRLSERKLTPIRREIGFLFQMAALFDSMTVAENIEFPLVEHSTLSPMRRQVRVRQALQRVDLEGIEGKFPGQLSGGQRKRVGLARAIILNPSLVLYDEPTTGLDPVRADGINSLIIRLQKELGVTSIVVTHDLVSAERVADRVVVLHSGHILEDGTWDQLQRSSSQTVRSFLAGRDEALDALDDAPTAATSTATEGAA